MSSIFLMIAIACFFVAGIMWLFGIEIILPRSNYAAFFGFTADRWTVGLVLRKFRFSLEKEVFDDEFFLSTIEFGVGYVSWLSRG